MNIMMVNPVLSPYKLQSFDLFAVWQGIARCSIQDNPLHIEMLQWFHLLTYLLDYELLQTRSLQLHKHESRIDVN